MIDKNYFINQIEQYLEREGIGRMKTETNGWGDSMISTKYVYERLFDILDDDCDIEDELSRFMDELAHNYKIDTGKLIGYEL